MWPDRFRQAGRAPLNMCQAKAVQDASPSFVKMLTTPLARQRPVCSGLERFLLERYLPLRLFACSIDWVSHGSITVCVYASFRKHRERTQRNRI